MERNLIWERGVSVYRGVLRNTLKTFLNDNHFVILSTVLPIILDT